MTGMTGWYNRVLALKCLEELSDPKVLSCAWGSEDGASAKTGHIALWDGFNNIGRPSAKKIIFSRVYSWQDKLKPFKSRTTHIEIQTPTTNLPVLPHLQAWTPQKLNLPKSPK
jgi:hypothetical protein